jgi:hypothetical protein
MMTVIVFIVAGLFGLKIIWNVLTPFALALRALKSSGKTKGISMAPLVEIGLLLLLIFLSAITNGTGLLHQPKIIALWGAFAVLGSYFLFIVLGITLGWLVAVIQKRRNKMSR